MIPATNEAQPAPIRVLIVDDDEGHAEALSDGLETENCACRIAHSGTEGIALMSESTFDAILTDLVMHDVDGLKVLEHAIRLQPEAAVLMITGHASVENADSTAPNAMTVAQNGDRRIPA